MIIIFINQYEPGTEIYAIYRRSYENPRKVYVFGKGVVESNEIPPEWVVSTVTKLNLKDEKFKCHKLKMDNGETIWSTYCTWWGKYEAAKELLEGMEIEEINFCDIEDIEEAETAYLNSVSNNEGGF